MKESKLLFKIRTRMLDIKHNYKKKYSSKNGSENDSFLCNICKSHEDNAENVLHWGILVIFSLMIYFLTTLTKFQKLSNNLKNYGK